LLDYPGSPVDRIEVAIETDRVIQKGVLRKALKIPFSIVGTVSVTPEGELLVHATSIRVAGVGVRRLMDVFGLRMEKLLKLDPERGVRIVGAAGTRADGPDFQFTRATARAAALAARRHRAERHVLPGRHAGLR
jgi:hypothetical protein